MKFALSVDQLATAIGAYLTKHGFAVEEGDHQVEVRMPNGFFTMTFSYKEPMTVGLEESVEKETST